MIGRPGLKPHAASSSSHSCSARGPHTVLLAAAFAGVTWLSPTPAQADGIGGLQLFIGLGGSAETDDEEVKINGVSQPLGNFDDDEDIEDTLGLGGYYVFELAESVYLGPRALYLSGEGEDSNADFGSIDLGVLFRYVFVTTSVRPYLEAGLGFTYGFVESNVGTQNFDLDGPGWHLTLGGGVGAPVSPSIALFGGLQWHRQQAFLKGDDTIGGADVEAEYTATASRVLLTAGVEFL